MINSFEIVQIGRPWVQNRSSIKGRGPVYPFELYCKQCGSKITSAKANLPDDLDGALQSDMRVDSWLSDQLRKHHLICPTCKRVVRPDPVIRSDVMFMEWDDSSTGDGPVMYYI